MQTALSCTNPLATKPLLAKALKEKQCFPSAWRSEAPQDGRKQLHKDPTQASEVCLHRSVCQTHQRLTLLHNTVNIYGKHSACLKKGRLVPGRFNILQQLLKRELNHEDDVGASVPLMVRPSSTPLFFGSFTWNVPLLGTTDSVEQTQEH